MACRVSPEGAGNVAAASQPPGAPTCRPPGVHACATHRAPVRAPTPARRSRRDRRHLPVRDGAVHHWAMTDQRPPSGWLAPASIGAGLVVLAALLAFLVPRVLPAGEPPAAKQREQPRRIQVLRPAGPLGAAIGGYGDVWVQDRMADELLRVTAPEGRVLARIPVD